MREGTRYLKVIQVKPNIFFPPYLWGTGHIKKTHFTEMQSKHLFDITS